MKKYDYAYHKANSKLIINIENKEAKDVNIKIYKLFRLKQLIIGNQNNLF